MDTTATAPTRPTQVELPFTDAMRSAVEHAFAEAQHKLVTAHEIRPYTTVYAEGGFDIEEHAGATVEEVYSSVRELIARKMPDFYVLTYDGFIETPTGVRDAVTCEVARRGDSLAQVLALPYTVAGDEYTFRGTYGSAGSAEQLYPSDQGENHEPDTAHEDKEADDVR